MLRLYRIVAACMMMFVLVLVPPWIAVAVSQEAPTPGTPINTQTIAEVVDALATDQMAEQDIPGMPVASVFGDEVIFSRGYGCSDLHTRRPMDPTSVFRAASVSKLFTATALMPGGSRRKHQ